MCHKCAENVEIAMHFRHKWQQISYRHSSGFRGIIIMLSPLRSGNYTTERRGYKYLFLL